MIGNGQWIMKLKLLICIIDISIILMVNYKVFNFKVCVWLLFCFY